tara:strand:- start:698 stop:1321 length:624 start_codon:yes stop_codon:yes gene_type:complete
MDILSMKNKMLKRIRSLFSNSDYFGIYDNALSKKECEIIINQFEKSSHVEGKIYCVGEDGSSQTIVQHDQKKSIELKDAQFSDKSIISNIVREKLIKYIGIYNAEQPQLHWLDSWGYHDAYNIQKYETEEDGYKMWHCEHGASNSNRILAWMFYLNDAKSGTEFMNYPTVQAKRGRCVIWPAFWTHVHKGAPNKGLKYIATGWISLC